MTLDLQRRKVLDELIIASAIITWYVGTVLGVHLAAYLLSHRTFRFICVSVIPITFDSIDIFNFNFNFQCAVAILTVSTSCIYLSSIVQVGAKPCDQIAISVARFIGGVSSGAVYFIFIVIVATDHSYAITRRAVRSSIYEAIAWIVIFVPITFALNSASVIPLNPVQGEYFCYLFSLIFAVFVLLLGVHLNDTNQSDKLCLVHVQPIGMNKTISIDEDTIVADASAHHQTYSRSSFNGQQFNRTFFDDQNIRPLMYLIGAKLLTILCSNIPFFYIAINYFVAIDTFESNTGDNVSQCHLIALLSARVLLGAVANNNIFTRDYVYKVIKPILGTFGANFLISLALRHVNGASLQRPLFNTKHIAGWLIVCAYIASSICIDAFSHAKAISQSRLPFIKRPLAVAFAACIEHLIHILFIAVYLSDVSSIKLFMFTFLFISISAMWQRQGERIKQTKFCYGDKTKCDLRMDIL